MGGAGLPLTSKGSPAHGSVQHQGAPALVAWPGCRRNCSDGGSPLLTTSCTAHGSVQQQGAPAWSTCPGSQPAGGSVLTEPILCWPAEGAQRMASCGSASHLLCPRPHRCYVYDWTGRLLASTACKAQSSAPQRGSPALSTGPGPRRRCSGSGSPPQASARHLRVASPAHMHCAVHGRAPHSTWYVLGAGCRT